MHGIRAQNGAGLRRATMAGDRKGSVHDRGAGGFGRPERADRESTGTACRKSCVPAASGAAAEEGQGLVEGGLVVLGKILKRAQGGLRIVAIVQGEGIEAAASQVA